MIQSITDAEWRGFVSECMESIRISNANAEQEAAFFVRDTFKDIPDEDLEMFLGEDYFEE